MTPSLVTPSARLRSLAERRPGDVAVTLVDRHGTERSVTFGELDERATRLAYLLRDRGVDADDRVVVALPNSLEHVVAQFATWRLGACVVTLDSRLPTTERHALVRLADAAAVVADWDLSGVVSRRDLDGADSQPNQPLPDVIPEPAKAVASGGSTGHPKLIVDPKPWAYPEGQPHPLAVLTGLAGGTTTVVPGPLYHNAPFLTGFVALFEGQHLVLLDRFDPAATLEAIERHEATGLSVVPTMMARMARQPDIDERDLSTLRCVVHTAGPCPAWVKEAWLDLVGPEAVVEVYGATELVGLTAIRGDEWLAHRGSVGRGFDSEFVIVRPDGSLAEPGEVGEVYSRRLSSSAATYSYLGSVPAPTWGDGYTSVGDLGWVDEAGYLYLADRRKDLIITGGENVYPAEVEAALTEHPGVADAAVVGLDHEDLGQIVHAIVVPADPALTAEELDHHCRERLVRAKCPRSFELVDELPRNDAGKLRRSDLKTAATADT